MNIDAALAPLAGKRILCAVSGGADSMCLLYLLSSRGFDVAAAHFEHGIRGAESLRDRDFVAGWCRENGIPFLTESGDTPAFAAQRGCGLEQAARELRYAFLFRAAASFGADCIATAHTMDDNAETLLFHLVRGSGGTGLGGIPPQRGRIVRPLLGVTRAEVERFLAENAVPFVEDSTNGSDDYTRNLLRHRVVPALREINPRFAEAAARTAALARRDEACLSALAEDFLARELRDGSLELAALRALHPAIASRAVRQLVPGLSMERCEAVLAFAQGSEYGLLQLPGQTLRREQGRLWLGADGTTCLPARRVIPGEALALPEIGLRLETEPCVYRGEIHDLFKTSFVKYEIVSSDLLCTGRRPGDTIRPAGRGLSKRLSALFKEAGYTRARRDACPVLRDAEGPLLVRGLALDERAAPRPGDRALKISFKRLENRRL